MYKPNLPSAECLALALFFWMTAIGQYANAQQIDLQPDNRQFNGQERHDNKSREVDSVPPNARDTATRILHQTLLESVWGVPVFCEVRQTTEWFGKKRSGFGKYVRGGKGSGRMRMSLQIPAGDQMNTLLQVSDGEILTTSLTVGQHMSRTQVDLGKVRERLTLTVDSLQDPTTAMYLAIGGQAEILRKLLQQYDWNELSEDTLGHQRVWRIQGTAADRTAPNASRAQIDVRLFEEGSEMQPIQATLIIGHMESKFPFWLYQVEQWYQPTSPNRSPLYAVTEWDAPTRLTSEQLSPELFRFPSPEHQASQEIREETKLYLPPLLPNMASRPDPSGAAR